MVVDVFVSQESIVLQAFDRWHAYQQSQGHTPDIRFLQPGDSPRTGSTTILFDVLPRQKSLQEYDLVLLCNEGEPVTVATPLMTQWLQEHNAYFLCNSQVTVDHPLSDKIIWWPDDMTKCRDFWCRPYYPQYHAMSADRDQHSKHIPIVAINGQQRSWRWYFFQLLAQSVPEISIVNNLKSKISATTDSQWETNEDREFRDWVNGQVEVERTIKTVYHTQGVEAGIGGKFGQIPPGYFIMPEYFDSHCVIYCESTWQNNEICLTEKALKCFYAYTLPIPVGGAFVNQLYNELGYSTAWNLLPVELQRYDTVLDHRERYLQLVQAIKWLWNNSEIFHSDTALTLARKNFENFMIGRCEYMATQQLDNVIKKHERRH